MTPHCDELIECRDRIATGRVRQKPSQAGDERQRLRRPALRAVLASLAVVSLLAGFGNDDAASAGGLAGLPALATNSDLVGSFEGQNDIARRMAATQRSNFGDRLGELRGDTCQRLSVDLSLSQQRDGADAWDRLITDKDSTPEGANPRLQSNASAKDKALCGGWNTHAWTNGHITLGSLQAEKPRLGFDYVASGISTGLDLRQSTDLSVGVGVGFDTDKTKIGEAGTRIGATGVSAAIYGSYHPKSSQFVEGLAGLGGVELDNSRATSDGSAIANGHRIAGVAFGQISAGLEERAGDVTLRPYGRLAVDAIHLRPYQEASANEAVAMRAQSQVALRSSIGVKASLLATRIADWLRLAPWVEIEAGRDQTLASSSALSLVANPAANHHRLTDPATGNRRLSIGVGTDVAVFDGIDVKLSYRRTRETSAGISQQFEVSSRLPF
ncbi:autotransporter outer membrane beta-barrel domain-containing protein [Aurantimonas sp. VKM B-3413]|uniref:autotransporter outer membrane beta-barrel domain-containing protein n=1 Tax=Aurantimonas sp. VKM B-3413 TaxID=2779401 RepID=UPI001E41096E|nr:autotransporter outer membrane beta-barrel domain-containing protein [Aurantimonas sp. VKM B-3413]MCB8836885.1 autotransporter outer membrane beta-barrel domain-containing protein [Aurantimonas sp. VKM B-3413]